MNKPNAFNTAENNRKIMQMPNIRIFYKKLGRAKYISHLDLMRCMQRSLKRAGIPVWYTQGFNPHMYMTFALPLSLGYESEYEIMDLRITEEMDFDKLKERFNATLPPDIRVFKVSLQDMKPQTIKKALYAITFMSENANKVASDFEAFCNKESIVVTKKTKKGEKQIDIKPEFEIKGNKITDNGVTFFMLFTAGERNFNPSLLIDLFLSGYDKDIIGVSVLRKMIYNSQNKEFI